MASIGLCLVGAYGALQPRVNGGQEIKTENLFGTMYLFLLSIHSLSVKAFFKCCILLYAIWNVQYRIY